MLKLLLYQIAYFISSENQQIYVIIQWHMEVHFVKLEFI